jgi:lipopolysaccharide transport system permease protein
MVAGERSAPAPERQRRLAQPLQAEDLQSVRRVRMSRPLTVFEPPAFLRLRPLAALRELREHADLLLTLSLHRVRVRYKQSRLGILWAVLQPLAMMLVFALMFTFLRAAPDSGVPFPLFAYAALVPWTMFASGLTSASGALTSHATLLTKAYFPREILPLTYVVAALVDFVLAAALLGLLMAGYRVPLTWTALWVPPVVAILAVWLIGLGLFLSALQVRFRDVALAMPVLVQVWLFATPVIYPLETARHALPPPLYALYVMNPMAGIVDTFRRAVVLHQAPDLQALATAALVAGLVAPAAYVYFKLTERTVADVV